MPIKQYQWHSALKGWLVFGKLGKGLAITYTNARKDATIASELPSQLRWHGAPGGLIPHRYWNRGKQA